MSGSYKFRHENSWYNNRRLYMVGDDEDYNINNWYSSQQNDSGSERSNRNGHGGKDGMAYGGLAYYDNALYTGPHSYKGSFSVNPDYPGSDTYRSKKSRWLIALIVIVLLLVLGIAVFLGVYFGVMEKTDKVNPVLQTEPGKFQGTLKMNNAWDPKYGDHTTTEFTNLKTNLENQLTSMYQNSALKNDFNKVTVTGFSEGSIVGVYILDLKAATVQTQNSVLQITKQAVLTVQADAGSSDDLIKAVNAQEIVIAAVLVTTTTTQAQPTTTQAPDTTTQAPDTTTQAPDTTTQAQPTTTQAPDTTTQAPDTTTQAPDTTTQAQPTTTQAPDTTTQAPDTTTQAPDTTTQAPDTTTQAPDTTTKAPDNTTTQTPDTTTKAPDTTTKAPDNTTTQTPDTTTKAPDTTTKAPDTTTPPPATTTPADQNPCVDYSLLGTIAIGCISKHAQALTAETTTEGKCRVLLDDVITCVVSDIHTQYNKTCTEKEQHNIIVSNKDTIAAAVQVNPVLCLPTASCMNIRAITYYMPIICEDQIKLLRSSGNCSDFSDALKCYYYHTRIEYTCDLDTFMMAVTNNYTALVTDIGKPDLTCPVDTLRIDPSVKTSLCQDPDVMQVIVDMYCPHDLRDFIQASSDDKCMYGHNLVVCIVQQLTSVFKTTCMTDDIYKQMKIYQSQIIGVSNQLNIQSCQGTTPMTTETMTTTMTMTTTATIVVVKGEFEANLKINATWDPKYEDKNSTEYKDLTERFRNQTLSMYKNSSLEVEDIIVKELSQGSVYFVFVIIFKKDAPNIDSLTPEMVIEATKKIIETIQENPSDSFDLIQNTDVAEITIIQVTEILTKCDRVPYIKYIVEKYCNKSRQQLNWAIQPKEQCRIFLLMTGCVVYSTGTCSVKKVTRTISSNLNDFVENMPGFDPKTCYDEDNVVLPTMMPITAPVKPCAHPDVLSYILNFDCNYDAIPSHFEQDASTLEQCRFYWQSSACVYNIMKDNPVLQGQCSYDEITGVLQKYEAQIYRVHPINVNSSVCFAYDRDLNNCSSMLYDPDMYAHFRDCFNNTLGIRMNPDVDTSAVTCVLYEESFECVYRFYQQKGLASCNKTVLEKNVIWMTNSINSVISKHYGQNFTEPDVVQTCIENSSSDPDFGQSLCQDGVGILTANAECLNRYITAVKTRSLSVCSGLKNVFIPCVMEKIAKIDNCSAAEMIASVIKEKDLVLTMSSGHFDISRCDEALSGDVCTTYNTSIIETAVQCAKTLPATANKANAGHAFCSAYNVYLRCAHIIIEKTTGKPCAKSSLDIWMPYVTEAYTNFTKEDAQACTVTDDNDDDMCHDIKTLEDMALYSQCGVAYIQYFKTYPDCGAIFEPYFKCLNEMFPSCDIEEIARKLMMSTNFTDKLQPGFNVSTCLKDDVSNGDICATYNISILTTAAKCAGTLSTIATRENAGHVFCSAYNVYLSCVQYVIEEETGKTCKKLSLDMWMPYLVSRSTNFTVEDAQACNVTDDGMCPDVRTLEVMATYSACSVYVQYLRVYPDCRSIIEPYFKCLAGMFPACNVIDLAKTLMMSQDFADKLPTESTLLGCLKGSGDGLDICASYNANLTSALTQCGGATYGYMIGTAPKYAFCSAYNVLVNCVHSLVEENTGKMCNRSSLHTWLPFIISTYINVTSEEIQACNVTEDDVDDDVICNDVISIEEMAYYSSCGVYYSALTSFPDCGLVKPYMECLVVLFPSCDAREIVKTLLTSPNFTARIPQGFDILDCIGGADICRNYTDIVRNLTECSMAVSGFKDKEPRMELLCRSYNVYVSCLEVTINKMGKFCEERSLRIWVPQYMERSFNLSASTVQTCNVTDKDPHMWCTDIKTLEMMALETPCGRDFEMLATNPSCLSAEKFLKCMEGIFPECEGKTLAQSILMSPLLRNKIPLDFDPMTCVTEDVTTTTSPTPTMAPDCNSVEHIKRFATVQCDAARNQLTLVQNSKQCGVFLDMVGCIVFNSMTCSAEEVVRTLNRDLWGIIGKDVTGFNSTTCYDSEDNIVFPTIVPTAPLIPCENPHVLRYILNYNCYYDGLENFMQGNMPLESCRIYWFSSSCVYGYTKDNPMLGNCSYQDITDVLEKYDDELYLVRPVDVNASVCFEYNRDIDKCSTILYDPTYYTLFYDCYSTLLTTRMNPLLNTTGLDCLLYEENVECGFRFYEQIGLGWCDKMQFEKDWTWYINGLDAIMTKAIGTPLGQPDVVERCIANVSMAPDFGMYLCRDIKGLILSNVLCIHSLQFSRDVCSTLRTEYIPCLMKKADDYKMMCSDVEDFMWNGIIRESALIKHLTSDYVDISKCNPADKRGACPPVTNHTDGGCVEECSEDRQCIGNQKCCSNGCGHTCVDPSPEKMSRIFEITFRFDIPWKPEYRNGTGYMMLTTKISDQLRSMVYNSTSKDIVDYIQILNVRQGSVLVTIVIGFNQYLTPYDVRQETINLVKAVQEQPPSSSNDLIQKIDLSYIMVSERRDGPITTTTRPIAVEDCHSVTYIKQFVTSQCDSARNQLTKVENSTRCSVFLDLVGCVVHQSEKCTVDEVMMTLNKDLWGIIGQNITGFDPVTCYGSGSQIVLPTIMPLNATLKPCMHPDVLSYVLKYNCYYTALEQQMNGDTELESCRFYWYSSSCVYGALKDNAKMGNCSYQEIAQVLQMYENQLYMISPNNVNASVCFDYDRSMERCSTFLYDSYSYHYFFDCYSSGYINRNNWALDVSDVGCMIYEESYECMYRFYKQERLGSCDRMQFEEDVIWLTNSMNDIMSQATGTQPDSPDTVKTCIANVSHASDFGQDLCEDGKGLIMADTVCLIYLQYSPDKCSGIKTTYLPCLLRKTADYRMACSKDMAYASIMKESDLILKLTMNMVDISKCVQDEDKVGECPSVRNNTGICLQNCTYDKECAGNQKCCSNGCGHMCVEPVSKVFKMTFRFNITWNSDYGDQNSTKHAALTADILNQVNTMVANSQIKDSVEWLKIIGIREGSVYVDFLISLITELTADDLRLTTVMLVQTVQANPISPLDKIKSINTDDIHVTIYKGNTTDKRGVCPPVTNHTDGVCVEECSADWQCTGNQKCCSNGCGHTCVDPSPEKMSRIFEITFRFDIPWKPEYRNGTGYMMLTTKISDQLRSMVYNSTSKDIVDYIQILNVRQGSVLVTIVIGFNQYLTPYDVRQETINLVKAVQEQPPSSSNDLIQKIDLSYIMVSERRDGPITTTTRPIAVEDCHSVTYIKQFVTSQCDSARNQLTKVENSTRCSVFLDLVGCVVHQSEKCTVDEVMMTLNKDLWGIIGQNITGFDPVTCYGSGSQIVLPTIMPLNATLKPCMHPDVLSYVLKYNCYYTALEQQMNGDTELESCRFYWYSSSCVYGALKDNAKMGNCSYQEIAQVLQMYENQLYMISPNNVNASVCFDYDRSMERCSTFLYDSYSYHYFFDCYSSGYINRNNWALDVSDVGCMIYEESYECMYRFYKQERLGSCDRMQFEEDVIWLTNSMNDIMSQATGTQPDSPDTVKTCIANVSHASDFGQDLCEDGKGLIMADTVCLIYLQYSPDKCSGIKTTYLPCLLRKTADYRMACSKDMAYASIMKESDLILKLTMNMVDISKCVQDEDKVGECPSVRNNTGICLQNCTYDKECAGNQKCCSNGCGHMCVEPVSKVFKMTFRFNITWNSDYGDQNSTKHAALTADILNQVNTMVANSQIRDSVEWLKIIGIREGSVYVDFLISLITELTADDLRLTTVMLVQTVQANPISPLDKIKSINTDDIHVTIYKGTETDDDDDDCSDYNRITSEFRNCSVYLIRFTDMSDSDLDNCGLYNYFIDCVINIVSDVGKTCREDSLRKWMPTALANMGNPALEVLKNCPGYVDGVCKDEPIIQHIFMTACNYTLDYIALGPCRVIKDTVSSCMLPSMPGSRCTGDQIGSTLLKSSQIKNKLPDDFDPTSCGYSGIEGPGSCPAVTTVGVCVEKCNSNSSCTGGQKCCFNGCGHVCMDPVSDMSAERFQITFRINITWTEAYRNKNSTEYATLQTNLENQLNQILSNSTFKDIVEYIKVIDFRPGSVMAVCELKLTESKPLDDVKSGTRQIILQEQQKNPSSDNLLQVVDPDDIHVIILSDTTPSPSVILKNGTCPNISHGNGSACADECTSDSSCTGDQKCCSDECGLKCMDPEDDDVCTDVETFRTIAATTCQSQIDQFSSSDTLFAFCGKLSNLDTCIKGALPTYGCPNEIATETYPKLFGLLDQLLGFSASSMVTQCFS